MRSSHVPALLKNDGCVGAGVAGAVVPMIPSPSFVISMTCPANSYRAVLLPQKTESCVLLVIRMTFRTMRFTSILLASFRDAILDVVASCADEQMSRIATAAVIAPMANVPAVDVSQRNSGDEPMYQDSLA